jgi:ABC-type multidrug transport system fused ATPase/permease subunit
MPEEKKKKKKIDYSRAWAEARVLVWNYRWRLALGLLLMLISRGAGFVLPYSTKFLVDNVFGQAQYHLLKWIALAVGVSTLISAATSFALSQVLGVAAQRAITEMRKRVQAHIERLPTSYFDSTQTGQLISRIMRDAEGIRNLVGTGLGQILGGLLSALVSVVVLFYLNWQITIVTLVVLAVFGVVLSYAFGRLRPLFRDRGEIEAQVTGRLNEGLGGIRIVKAYTAEKREELSFARRAPAFSQHRQIYDGRFGDRLFRLLDNRRHRRRDDLFRRQCGDSQSARSSTGDDFGRFYYVHRIYDLYGPARSRSCQHRHADHRSLCRARPHLGSFRDADRNG